MAYWNSEKPVTFRTEKNEFRVYEEACKIQVFPIVPNAPRGIGRGATIDLEEMDLEELESFQDTFNSVIESMKERL